MVKTHTSKVFVAALMTATSRVSEVASCAYSHASPRRHCLPLANARQGIFPSGKKSTSSVEFSFPPAPPPPPPNCLHMRSNSAAKILANRASRITVTFSWFPSTACRVQLKLPLTNTLPSITANL